MQIIHGLCDKCGRIKPSYVYLIPNLDSDDDLCRNNIHELKFKSQISQF